MIKQISNDEYHKPDGYISSTQLKNFTNSPLHYKCAKEQPKKDTAALLFGCAVHDLIESTITGDYNEFNQNYINIEQAEKEYFQGAPINRRTSEYKVFKEQILSDKIAVPIAVWHIVKNMFRNGFIKWLLTGGVCEMSIFQELALPFEDRLPATIPVKVRPDYINVDRGIIVDYKTLGGMDSAPTEQNCFKAINNYKYYISVGLYVMVCEKEFNKKFNFYFIFLEKEPPYDHNIIRVNRLEIERMFHIVHRLLNIYQKATYFDKFPGVRSYNDNEMQIAEYVLPQWVKDDYHCDF